MRPIAPLSLAIDRSFTALQCLRGRHAWGLCGALGLALLSACGGGGGGDSGSLPGSPDAVATVTIGSANRDAVARAATASVVGLTSGTSSVPLDAGLGAGTAQALARSASPTATSALQAKGSSLLPAAARRALLQWLQPAEREALYARAGQKRALAVTGPISQPCSLGGSIAITTDDSDNNSLPSAGDSVSAVFTACRDTADETLSGRMNLVYTQVRSVSETLVDLSARLTLTDLRTASATQTLSTSGEATMDLRSDLNAEDQLTVTVTTNIVATLSGNVTDTVTIEAGYVERSVYDSRTAAPEGGSSGRTTTTVSGPVSSTRAGGRFVLSTPTALVQFDVDAYPRSGVLLAQGSTGSMRLTALSASQAQLELDADGNGQYESSETLAWTALF